MYWNLATRWQRLSLTARMTTFFSGAIAVIVVGVSSMMYAELTHQLREKEETELLDAMRIQQEVFDSLARRQSPTQWQHEWDEQQQAGQHFAWVMSAAGGARLAQSSTPPGFETALATLPLPRRFVWIEVPVPGGEKTLLVHTMAPKSGPPDAVAMHGVLDVTQDHEIVERYRRKLFAVVLGTILLSTLFGWLLARRGLAPLRAISGQIGQMHPDRLETRIAQSEWPSELRVLALTFDGLIERIARSFEQLSRFSSDLAHEFRSPINNLVAAASVTLGRARMPSEYQTTLEVVVEEGERLSRMVTSMLFLARADNAKQLVRMEPVSTATEFGKLIDFFDIVAEEHGVTLVAQGDLTLPADPMLLRQALSNLVANALRHTARGGRIALHAEVKGAAVALRVSDDGCGIAAEHLPLIFDRFYRVDAARSATDSTGLGLSVVRSIAELHGGTVTVTSTPGQGTTFTLLLPGAPAPA
ncbi:MAG: heavy metal sensor histidine kinase [Pseudomonadota bacterium]|nr:heavy metal sensor histidine kinase [Pseudomonadota bacterium]